MAYLFNKIRNNGAPSYTVFYRVKGSGGPWINGGTYNATPAPAQYTEVTIMDVPPNEYEVYYVANCEDGISAQPSEQFNSTPVCPLPLALNVIDQGANFLVQYNFPSTVAQFNLQVAYPNGGNFNQVIAVDPSGQYTLAKPAGTYGDFTFRVRSVCNVSSNWYSPLSNPVIITVNDPSPCPPVEITSQARVGTGAGSETWRFTLGNYTPSVRVVVTNNTTSSQQIYTQAVVDNYTDIPLVKAAVDYNYTVQIFNLCSGGTDFIGDTTNVVVYANTTTVNTAGWVINAAPDTSDLNGDGVIGTRVDVTAPAPASTTQATEVTVRFNCSGSGYSYVTLTIPANQTVGTARDWNSGCTIDTGSGYINSAILL